MQVTVIACLLVLGACCTQSKVLLFEPRSETSNIASCPDGEECPDETTCCVLSSGKYGCCPMPNAVCCDDKEHCCPENHVCDVAHQRCISSTRSVALTAVESNSAKILPVEGASSVDTQCPDGSQCSGTCCQLAGGNYGCCPYEEATCCSDESHCCPNGYTCNVAQQTCDQGFDRIPFNSKSQSSMPPTTKIVKSVQCSDNATQCPDGSTCCELDGGAFGCCPYDQAMCCSDKLHCCPNGYTCNVAQQTCDKGFDRIPFSSKSQSSMPLTTKKVKDVQCSDNTTQCPDGSTCCELDGGTFGCCPYDQAMCCSDKLHCCPNGYTCNVAQQTCDKGFDRIPFSSKSKSSMPLTTKKVKNVQCSDNTTQCPDGSTCCELGGGGFGCCPYDQAVCCADKEHCCPHNYKCNLQQQTCESDSHEIPFAVAIMPVKTATTYVPCPGGQSACPDGSTCCPLASGEYGCCPLPQAVCCSDQEHCCPQGYTCDTSGGTCSQGGLSVPWSLKVPAKSSGAVVPSPSKNDVTECPRCKSGDTCCNKKCCPFENGICCDDGRHCCPAGSSCDAKSRMCQSVTSSLMFTWHLMNKQPINKPPVVESVDCPDSSQCDDGNTCCKQPSEDYGCCPLDKAVCCSDGLHCCPTGTQCDLAHSRCIQADSSSNIGMSWQLHKRQRARYP